MLCGYKSVQVAPSLRLHVTLVRLTINWAESSGWTCTTYVAKYEIYLVR